MLNIVRRTQKHAILNYDLNLYFSIKNESRRSCHIDISVGFIPFDM